MEINRNGIVLWLKKIIICTVSLILLGIGCGLNVATSQGADPITVFYDGLSKAFHVSVGFTASILNFSLILLVLAFSFVSAKVTITETKDDNTIASAVINTTTDLFMCFILSVIFSSCESKADKSEPDFIGRIFAFALLKYS